MRSGPCFHDDNAELAPGLTLHRVGGHSAGLQIARVWTKRGWVVLASDASHLYANFEQRRPFPVVYSVAEMLEGYNTLYRLADLAAAHRPRPRPSSDEALPRRQPGAGRHRSAPRRPAGASNRKLITRRRRRVRTPDQAA